MLTITNPTKTRRTDTTLAKFKVKTIRDLATFKFARWAEALVAAAEFENKKGGSA